MGFLDHSTNNIIVDAVLTDAGRRALARNDGSFSIYQFALGDDEVDYDIITQYGRTVGKEKIEKNTPVMEALTQGSLALKYPLIIASNELLTHLPVMEIATSAPLSFNKNGDISTQNIDVTIKTTTGQDVEHDLLDREFLVEVNNLFLSISGAGGADIVHTDNIAMYRYVTNTNGANGSATASIPITLKSIPDSTFNTYKIAGGNYIRTYVNIRGVNSGLSKTFEIQITNQ